jgi:hypothetical protein
MSVINQTLIAAVIKSFDKGAKTLDKVRQDQDKAIQATLDAMFIACDKPKALFLKGNAKTNPARGQIKAMFDAICEAGYISKNTAASYQTAFWIAFDQGIPFQRDLNNKDKAEGESGETKTSTKASGAVQSTSRTDLDKTLSKAMAQARLLGLLDFAADLVDLCQDRLDGFEETVLAK